MVASRRLAAFALALVASLSACSGSSGSPGSEPGTPPALALSSSSVSFLATQGGANPALQSVSVSNTGGGQLAIPTASVAYASGSGWLAATLTGSTPPYALDLQASVGALAPGTYQATVSVASAGAANSPSPVSVAFAVVDPNQPIIGLSPSQLAFTANAGGASPPAQLVAVSNTGGGSLAVPSTSVAYGSGSGWLAIAVSGASAPYSLSVRPTPDPLSAGTYAATVSVASTGAYNTPQTFAVTFSVVPPPPACKDPGVGCANGSECCSAICRTDTQTCSSDAFCASPGTPCGSNADCCSNRCPNAGSPGATCDGAACKTIGAACGTGSDCCSGVCAGGACAELPSGSTGATCTTLGEQCNAPLECCSHNCQGLAAGVPGWCAPAYTCNATGDSCWRAEDCCSGLCAPPAAPGQPGRCDAPSGGCKQDGIPCDNDSNCCTRLCVDLGSGTKVCQPAGGCRMTGDYCDGTPSCCNLNDVVPPSQAVECGADHTCLNGGGCNPPGNICGASTDVNASQNCCHTGGGSGKPVCKPDSNGIYRCFGGPVSETCATGWDGDDPLCCIPPGTGPESVCQFRDQCCNHAPCVPDAAGVLHCSASEVCLPRASDCTPASPDPCCDGTTCQAFEGAPLGGYCLEPPGTTCLGDGVACPVTPTGSSDTCCSGACTPAAPGATDGTCATCAPNGNGCTTDAQCCSGMCDGESGRCLSPCIGDSGSCTTHADCCSGSCDVPPGQTSGTCTTGGGGPACATLGQACDGTTPCCDASQTCTGGFCAAACAGASQACTATGNECCAGLSCVEASGNSVVPCVGSSCFCDPGACVPENGDCSGGRTCCEGFTCTNASNPLYPCPDPESPCACTSDQPPTG